MEFVLTAAKNDVDAIRASAAGDMERLLAAVGKCFPYKSATEASEAFKGQLDVNSSDNKGNDTVSAALFIVRDEISLAVEKIMTIERFIALSTPPMEDGNNFGVTVQMMVAKYAKEVKDDLIKTLDSLPGYFDARAGAYEKMPTVPSKSSTSSTSSSTSSGGKDGDEKKESTSTSTEEKKNGSTSMDRANHVVAIDVQFYFKFKIALTTLIDSYAVVIDNVNKNFDKLVAPKGTSGGNSMSMF
mmetsp:Transcript_11623/g.23818  ORF Transcript_11623/g.23818 Transcript_11623/m.23818 type:complete len:243 (+) Transcript_11623:36-764(+)